MLHSCSLDKKQENKAKWLGYWSPKRKTRLTDHLQEHAKNFITMITILHSLSLEKKKKNKADRGVGERVHMFVTVSAVQVDGFSHLFNIAYS